MEEKEKNTIITLENEGTCIEGDDNLLRHASEYYSDLFGPVPQHGIHLDPSIRNNCYKLSDSDNEILCQPFSETEISAALFQMKKNKAPGPDKMPIEFFQKCWSIIKSEVVKLLMTSITTKLISAG